MSKEGLKKMGDTFMDPVQKIGKAMVSPYTETAKGVKSAADRMTPDMPEPQSIEPPVQQSLMEQTQTSDRRQSRRRGLAGTLFAGRASAGGRQSAPLQRKTLLGGGS